MWVAAIFLKLSDSMMSFILKKFSTFFMGNEKQSRQKTKHRTQAKYKVLMS